MLEILVPATLRRLYKDLGHADGLRKLLILGLTLRGFPGGDPGHSNEDFLCSYLHKHPLVNMERNMDTETLVLSKDGKVEWEIPANKSLGLPLTRRPAPLDEIVGCITRWRVEGCEKGIDRIFIHDVGTNRNGKRRLKIELVQLKSGRRDISFTPGRLKSQREKPMDKVEDSTIAGVLVKAERGLAYIMPALHAAFPEVAWCLGKLLLFTTKLAAQADEKFRAAPEGKVVFRNDGSRETPLQRFTVDDVLLKELYASGINAHAQVAFEWEVIDGIGWLQEVLPIAYVAQLGLNWAINEDGSAYLD
jgi:hypothetical protein